MKLWRRGISAAAALATAVLCLGSCAPAATDTKEPGGPGVSLTTEDEWGRELKQNSEKQLVLEKDGVQLWIHGTTGQITIRQSAGGAEYVSFPTLDQPSMQSDGINASVEFINETGSQTFYNTMNDAMAFGQYSYCRLDGGLRITYILGELKTIRLAPIAISAERMESRILSQLDETSQTLIKTFYTFYSLKDVELDSDRAILLERYPSLSEHDIYALGTSTVDLSAISDLALSTVEGILQNTDYTMEDMQQDHKDNGIELEDPNKSNIRLSLDIVIEDGDVVAAVPGDGLVYDPDRVRIVNLELLPFLASSDQDGGYLMVPDGSGALIHFNNGKTKYEAYKKPIYGRDYTLPAEEMETEAAAEIYAPVFGVKAPSGSLLGIVEKGDAIGYINAAVAGYNAPVNRAYASFQLCQYILLHQYAVGSAPRVYQKEPYTGDLRVRYKLLGKGAGYVEMAGAYRDYLSETVPVREKDNAPVLVRFYGGVTEVRTTFLAPVKTILPLTTFDQAQEILRLLADKGAGRVDVNYVYWANNGVENTAGRQAAPLGKLGGRSGFQDLAAYVGGTGARLFPNVETLYVRKKSGDFRYKKQAARVLTDEIAYKETYNMATLLADEDVKTYIVSGNAMEALFAGLRGSLQGQDIRALSLASVGTDLNADYRQSDNCTREETKDILAGELKKFADEGVALSFSGGNAYVLPYASRLTDVPVTSSNHYLFDETVPFYPMALSGLLPLYSSALNTSSRYQRDLLACIESGVFPQYDLMYSPNSVLKETDYNYYGLYYEDWLDNAAQAYRLYDSDLRGLAGQRIVGHEQVADGVYCSRFENGRAVYVNYGDTQAVVNGVSVSPMSYAVAGKEGQR